LDPSPNIIWVIKYMKMRAVENVARMGGLRNLQRKLIGNHEWKRPPWDI